VGKQQIGKIQILTRETRVQISASAAASFAAKAGQPDDKDRNVHIEPVAD
jgi:ATP-dependent RNA helicase DeaD